MALTVAVTKRGVVGDMQYRVATVLWDSSYLTGGEAFTAADVGLKTIFGCTALGVTGTGKTSFVGVNFDETAGTLQAIGANGAAAASAAYTEVASTVDLSGVTSKVLFFGI